MQSERPLTTSATRTIRDQAQILRAGLLSGYTTVSDVVAWADMLIAEDRGRDTTQLFDLALLRSDDVGGAVSLLGNVPGEFHPETVGRYIAKLVREALHSGKFTERQAATALYVAMREGLSPDEGFVGMAYYFADGVDLAQRGIYGNLVDLRAEMLEYLSKAERELDEPADE